MLQLSTQLTWGISALSKEGGELALFSEVIYERLKIEAYPSCRASTELLRHLENLYRVLYKQELCGDLQSRLTSRCSRTDFPSDCMLVKIQVETVCSSTMVAAFCEVPSKDCVQIRHKYVFHSHVIYLQTLVNKWDYTKQKTVETQEEERKGFFSKQETSEDIEQASSFIVKTQAILYRC